MHIPYDTFMRTNISRKHKIGRRILCVQTTTNHCGSPHTTSQQMQPDCVQRSLILDEEMYAIRKDIQEFKNEILTTIDWLVGEVQRFDIEQTLISARWKPFPDGVNDGKKNNLK